MMLNNLRTVIGCGTANTIPINLQNVLGSSVNSLSNIKFTNVFSNTTYIKLVIGNGTTPVDATDYKLSNEITEGILCSNLAIYNYRGEAQSNVLCRISGVIENMSNDPITIEEIGLVFTDNNESDKSSHVLLIRENVDSYILPPGECVQLTFSII